MNQKIIPITGRFDNPKAMLGAMLENPHVVGFVGVEFVDYGDGKTCRVVVSNCTSAEMAFAGAMLTKDAIDGAAE